MISSFSVESACAMHTWSTSAVTATVETAIFLLDRQNPCPKMATFGCGHMCYLSIGIALPRVKTHPNIYILSTSR